jgi:hypothetical protein
MAEPRLIDLPLSDALRRVDRAAQKDFAAEGFEEKLAASYGHILQSFADRAQVLERKAAVYDMLDDGTNQPIAARLFDLQSELHSLAAAPCRFEPEAMRALADEVYEMAQKARRVELESLVREREIESLRTQLMAVDSALLARQSCDEIEQRLTDLKALEGGAAIVDLREHFARESRYNASKREGAGHDGAA